MNPDVKTGNPMKPSARIAEIIEDKYNGISNERNTIKAIVQYLDEQAEECHEKNAGKHTMTECLECKKQIELCKTHVHNCDVKQFSGYATENPVNDPLGGAGNYLDKTPINAIEKLIREWDFNNGTMRLAEIIWAKFSPSTVSKDDILKVIITQGTLIKQGELSHGIYGYLVDEKKLSTALKALIEKER